MSTRKSSEKLGPKAQNEKTLLTLHLHLAIADRFIFAAENEVCQNSCGYVAVVSVSKRFAFFLSLHRTSLHLHPVHGRYADVL